MRERERKRKRDIANDRRSFVKKKNGNYFPVTFE